MSKKKAMFFKGVSGSGAPIIESFTTDTKLSTDGVDEVSLALPTGTQTDDLLLVALVNNNGLNNTQWSVDSIPIPSGFTFITTGGSSASDSHFGLYYKVADDTEDLNLIFRTGSSGLDCVAWCFRISGVDTVNPINIFGTMGSVPQTIYYTSTTDDVIPPELTTTEDNCLAFTIAGSDGEDVVPYRITGAGWDGEPSAPPYVLTARGGAVTTGVAGMLTTKEVPTAGLIGAITVSTDGFDDGMVAMQFAIKGL